MAVQTLRPLLLLLLFILVPLSAFHHQRSSWRVYHPTPLLASVDATHEGFGLDAVEEAVGQLKNKQWDWQGLRDALLKDGWRGLRKSGWGGLVDGEITDEGFFQAFRRELQLFCTPRYLASLRATTLRSAGNLEVSVLRKTVRLKDVELCPRALNAVFGDLLPPPLVFTSVRIGTVECSCRSFTTLDRHPVTVMVDGLEMHVRNPYVPKAGIDERTEPYAGSEEGKAQRSPEELRQTWESIIGADGPPVSTYLIRSSFPGETSLVVVPCLATLTDRPPCLWSLRPCDRFLTRSGAVLSDRSGRRRGGGRAGAASHRDDVRLSCLDLLLACLLARGNFFFFSESLPSC